MNNEEYLITFWILNDNNYWQQQTKSYFANNKNSHHKAIKQFQNEFKNKQVQLVKCEYV